MKHCLVLSLLPALIACSGGSEPEIDIAERPAMAADSLPDVADQLIIDGTTLSEMLAQVDSVETAEEVRPAIDAMVADYRVIIDRMETMEEPNFSDLAAMASRARPLAEAQQRVATEIQRINRDHPEAAKVLREALRDLDPQ